MKNSSSHTWRSTLSVGFHFSHPKSHDLSLWKQLIWLDYFKNVKKGDWVGYNYFQTPQKTSTLTHFLRENREIIHAVAAWWRKLWVFNEVIWHQHMPPGSCSCWCSCAPTLMSGHSSPPAPLPPGTAGSLLDHLSLSILSLLIASHFLYVQLSWGISVTSCNFFFTTLLVVTKDGVYVLDMAAKIDATADYICKAKWGDVEFPPPFGREAYPEVRKE